MTFTSFIVGMMIGACLGVVLMCVLFMAKGDEIDS